MEYSNRYSLCGLWTNFILKLKYALLWLFKNVENNYHVNKLENSVDQVLQFYLRSFASLLKLTLFL